MHFSVGQGSHPVSIESSFPKARMRNFCASVHKYSWRNGSIHWRNRSRDARLSHAIVAANLGRFTKMQRLKSLLPIFILTTAVSMLAQIGVGPNPTGIAADAGGNIWAANYGGSSVTKIQASTGTVINTYPVGLN